MDRAIIDYYDRLAGNYDSDRFGNSYGRFVHQQEREILDRAVPVQATMILDMGCGTGRLSQYATHGCDASTESLKVATSKYPDKQFLAADLLALPFTNATFDAAFCFHVLMHLHLEHVGGVMTEIARVLKPGGIFVADVASRIRRRVLRHNTAGWHGSTSLSLRELAALAAKAGLKMDTSFGTILLPIHRFPGTLRESLVKIDGRLANRFPDLASYVVGSFIRERA